MPSSLACFQLSRAQPYAMLITKSYPNQSGMLVDLSVNYGKSALLHTTRRSSVGISSRMPYNYATSQ